MAMQLVHQTRLRANLFDTNTRLLQRSTDTHFMRYEAIINTSLTAAVRGTHYLEGQLTV